jgi:3-hydroxyisobutyrate dehydrogenase
LEQALNLWSFSMSTSVAILGLGIMGSALARDAARAGLNTTAWDRSAERAAKLASDKLHIAQTVPEAVRDADIVVTMVADADAVMSVMEERGGVGAMKAGAAWVQMSTIGVDGTDRAMRLAATRPDIVFVDAPVSGSKEAAEEGKLMVLASGDRARAGEAVQRFFDAISVKTHWLGEAGQGTRMKLLFNAWLGILTEGVAEVATLGNALGIAPERFSALASGGPLFPPWAAAKLEKIVEKRTSETEFPLRWAHKDVLLALAAAGGARSRLPILSKIGTIWAEAVRDFGADDLSAIYLALQQRREGAEN